MSVYVYVTVYVSVSVSVSVSASVSVFVSVSVSPECRPGVAGITTTETFVGGAADHVATAGGAYQHYSTAGAHHLAADSTTLWLQLREAILLMPELPENIMLHRLSPR